MSCEANEVSCQWPLGQLAARHPNKPEDESRKRSHETKEQYSGNGDCRVGWQNNEEHNHADQKPNKERRPPTNEAESAEKQEGGYTKEGSGNGRKKVAHHYQPQYRTYVAVDTST
jgi:hypothetical protein